MHNVSIKLLLGDMSQVSMYPLCTEGPTSDSQLAHKNCPLQSVPYKGSTNPWIFVSEKIACIYTKYVSQK